MGKTITKEQMEKIHKLKESVKGTMEYNKYSMACEFRNEKGRWIFSGWYHPDIMDSEIKTIKDKIYIYQKIGKDMERYEVTDRIKEVLDL